MVTALHFWFLEDLFKFVSIQGTLQCSCSATTLTDFVAEVVRFGKHIPCQRILSWSGSGAQPEEQAKAAAVVVVNCMMLISD